MNKLKMICNHKDTATRTVDKDGKVNGKLQTVKVKETYCKNKDCGMVLKTIAVNAKEGE